MEKARYSKFIVMRKNYRRAGILRAIPYYCCSFHSSRVCKGYLVLVKELLATSTVPEGSDVVFRESQLELVRRLYLLGKSAFGETVVGYAKESDTLQDQYGSYLSCRKTTERIVLRDSLR